MELRGLSSSCLFIGPLALALAACGTDAPRGGLTLNLSGFSAHAGKKVEFKVKDSSGASTLGGKADTVPPSGLLTLQVAGVFETGKNYRVDFYLDTDASNSYTPPVQGPPIQYPDQQWRLPVTGNNAGVSLDFSYNTTWTDISPF